MQSAQIGYLNSAQHLEHGIPEMIYEYMVDRQNLTHIFETAKASSAGCRASINAYAKEQVAIASSIGQDLLRSIADQTQELTDYISGAKLDYNFVMYVRYHCRGHAKVMWARSHISGPPTFTIDASCALLLRQEFLPCACVVLDCPFGAKGTNKTARKQKHA